MSCVQCQAYNHSLLGQSTMNLHYIVLTVKCLVRALAFLWNACRQGPQSVGKHYPMFCARLESFLTGNLPRQQSLITLGSQAPGATWQERTENSTTLVLFTSDKRHWYPSNNTEWPNDTGSKRPILDVFCQFVTQSHLWTLFFHTRVHNKLVSVAWWTKENKNEASISLR